MLKSDKKITMLPIRITKTIQVVEYEGRKYVRTRDVADVLEIKQPYEFNSDIKNVLGESAILKGKDTEGFRTVDDTVRTTYIEVMPMVRFLQRGMLRHKTNGTRMYVIQCLLGSVLNVA